MFNAFKKSDCFSKLFKIITLLSLQNLDLFMFVQSRFAGFQTPSKKS